MGKRVRRVSVRVPATSANLGPGFDVLGLALDLCNELDVEVLDKGPDRVTIAGEGRDLLPKDGMNLICQTMRQVMGRFQEGVSVAFRAHMTNRIPLARGLGSSAAARLAGLLAGNRLCDDPMDEDAVALWAAQMEGHADNVAPALFGGFCAAALVGDHVRYVRWEAPKEWTAVVCVPTLMLSTEKSRLVLPHSVSLSEATFNAGRVALLIGAITKKRTDLMKEAMEDRLHEPFREHLIPGMREVKSAALAQGALGVALSGAGSSLIAISEKGVKAERVGEAMEKAFRKAGVNAKSQVLKIRSEGAVVR